MLNINTKLLELFVNQLTYPDYSVLIHPQNIEKQYHKNMKSVFQVTSLL